MDLPLAILFELQTIEAQAGAIETAVKDKSPAAQDLLPIPRDQRLQLSFAQQRLWFLNQLMGPNTVYNMDFTFELDGDINVHALIQSVCEIERRHEVLRTRFVSDDHGPCQVIDPPSLEIREQVVHDSEALLAICHQEFSHCFDLAADKLFRARLLKQCFKGNYALILTMHHIVSDGWSHNVMLKELMSNYRAFSEGRPSSLPPLAIQYADFAHWQRQWLRGEAWKNSCVFGANNSMAFPSY